MPGAGDLKDRVKFQKRGPDKNGDATGQGPWLDAFTVWADIDYQRGSETAVSNRIQGIQPATILIRDSSDARTITKGYRAIKVGGLRDGEVFDIKSVAPAQERGFLHLIGHSGKSSG